MYKPDIDDALKRLQAFWAHDCLGRCALKVVARKKDCQPLPNFKAEVLSRKISVECFLEMTEKQMENFNYLAEAIPKYIPGLVCSDIAAYFSSSIEVQGNTVWYPPVIDDWSQFDFIFDRNNRWWQLTRQMAEAAVECGRDKYLIGIPDFQPAMDIVSLLRSPGDLCCDLADKPAQVKQATDFIFDKVYVPCYREIRSIIARHSDLVSDWLGLASTGDHDIVQCDFCALISPDHFEEFCLPDIQKQCRMLDTSIFHLDGPDAIRHLDMLLEIKELDAIQWAPGAGKPPAKAWLPMLKKIQGAGKSLFIDSSAEDVKTILRELSPKGLLVAVDDIFESVEEASSFISDITEGK